MEVTNKSLFINLETYTNNVRAKKTGNLSNSSDSSSSGLSGATSNQASLEDNVVLSPKALEIQKAKKLISSVPDIRHQKVAQIKKQIESGTYQVNGTKIADSMIRESLLNELL